jgi:hypothetical protein
VENRFAPVTRQPYYFSEWGWRGTRNGAALPHRFENAIYHLCARGNARQLIFRADRDRARFLKLVSESPAAI